MRRFLLFISTYAFFFKADSQKITAKDFLFTSSISPKKFETLLNRKKFIPGGSRLQNDTTVTIYALKEKKENDPVLKKVETYRTKDHFSFAFFTSSKTDFDENIRLLNESGFFCGNKNDTAATSYLFQKRNIAVQARINYEPDTIYAFRFNNVELPALESIRNAEDLLQFYSHEFLVSVFGEKNVIKDLYYFSEKEVTKCSVLFPHTNRQAVFIWGDEINLSGPIYLVIGGNLNTASNANYDKVVEENVWRSKDGIYSGMSLNDLIKLNNSDLNFYGKDSKFPFMVVPDNRGVLNFKKNRVVLGCLNPNGSGLLNNEQVSGNEALFDNRAMYVFMIMFPTSPGKDELFLSTK